jgi:hypothetical protein
MTLNREGVPRVRAAVPIRVRGMSSEEKFFDEQTSTCLVDSSVVIIRLRSLVDLETEVHITSLKNHLAGTFRVLWINTDGRHDLGLELVETEGDLWEVDGAAEGVGSGAQALLQCQRCLQSQMLALPEVEKEFIRDGFVIARACERCKATTPWAFTRVETRKRTYAEAKKDQRGKGRAPLKMQIKVIRHQYNSIVEDNCATVNVSRHGVYFLTRASYTPGETVQLIMPYKEGDVAIPVSARVVRQVDLPDSYFRGVALHLEPSRK